MLHRIDLRSCVWQGSMRQRQWRANALTAAQLSAQAGPAAPNEDHVRCWRNQRQRTAGAEHQRLCDRGAATIRRSSRWKVIEGRGRWRRLRRAIALAATRPNALAGPPAPKADNRLLCWRCCGLRCWLSCWWRRLWLSCCCGHSFRRCWRNAGARRSPARRKNSAGWVVLRQVDRDQIVVVRGRGHILHMLKLLLHLLRLVLHLLRLVLYWR